MEKLSTKYRKGVVKMVTIRVFYKNTDKAAKGVGVIILLYDVMFLAIPDEKFTDSNGDANIDSDLGCGSVYVNGKKVFDGQIESRTVVYI